MLYAYHVRFLTSERANIASLAYITATRHFHCGNNVFLKLQVIIAKKMKHGMDNVLIRKAVKEDCSRILELIHELAVFEKAPDEVTVSLQHFEESGFGKAPVWWGFVAEANGFVQAFALYYIRYSTWKGQRMYLEDLLVTEELRGKGIGTLLFDELIKEAKEKGLNGIVWQVLEWNEPAIKFYKKLNASFDAEWVNCSVSVPFT
jgi:GNAT superfamily N-acetyltransferase